MASKWIDNGNDGTFTLIRDDGERQVFMDPDGSFRRELDSMSNAKGVISDQSGDASGMPVQKRVAAESAALVPQPQMLPDARVAGAGGAIEPLGGGDVEEAGDSASSGGGVKTTMRQSGGSSSERSVGTSTVDADKTGAIAQAGTEQIAAQRRANQADVANRSQVLRDRYAAGVEQGAQLKGQQDAQELLLARQAQIRDEVLQERSAARKRQIDPARGLGDGAGAMALAATIGSAIANVGRAWMGQSAQPITIIDDIINRSIKLQLADRDLAIEDADMRYRGAASEHERIRARVLDTVTQQLDLQKRQVTTKEEWNALGALAAKYESDLAQLNTQIAEKVAIKETASESRSSGSSSSSGTDVQITPEQSGLDAGVFNPEWRKAVEKLAPGVDWDSVDDAEIINVMSQGKFPGSSPAMRKARVTDFRDWAAKKADADKNTEILDDLQALAAAYAEGQDVSGLGRVARRLPAELLERGGKMTRQQFGAALSSTIKALSGTAASEKEVKRIESFAQGSGSLDEVLQGVKIMRQLTSDTVKEVEADALNNETYRILESRKAERRAKASGAGANRAAQDAAADRSPSPSDEVPLERANRERVERNRAAQTPIRESEDEQRRRRELIQGGRPY
jgi:hypothetical protein